MVLLSIIEVGSFGSFVLQCVFSLLEKKIHLNYDVTMEKLKNLNNSLVGL